MRDPDNAHAEAWILAALPVALSLAIWRGGADVFMLPRAATIVVAVTALAALGVVRVVKEGALRLPASPLAVALAALLGCAVIVAATSGAPAIALGGVYKRYSGLIGYASYIGVALAALRYIGAREVDRVVRGLLISVVAVVGYGLVQVLDADPLDWQNLYGDAVFSTLGNPNFAAAYVGIGAPLLVACAAYKSRNTSWRLVAAVTLAASVPVLLGTEAAQGALAAAAGLSVFVVVGVASFAPRWRDAAVAAWGASALGGLALGVAAAARLGPLAAGATGATIEIRRHYWTAALAMFRDRPLFGVGLDRFSEFYREYRTVEAARALPFSATADEPHNVVLWMFSSGGLFLGLAYLAFITITGWVFLRGLRTLNGRPLVMLGGVGGAWLAYQAQSLVSIDVPPLAVLHFLLAALIVVMVDGSRLRTVTFGWAPTPPKRQKGRRSRRPVVASPRTRVASAVAGAAVAAVTIFAMRSVAADVAANEAARDRTRNDLEAAVDRATAATNMVPWQATYWYELGSAHLARGDNAAAQASFEKAIQREPRGLQHLVSAARAAQAAGDDESAARWYERALEVEPHAVEMNVEAGKFYVATNKLAPGIAALRRATVTAPEIAENWLLLGDAYTLDGDRRAAADAYRKALAVDPENALAKERLEATG